MTNIKTNKNQIPPSVGPLKRIIYTPSDYVKLPQYGATFGSYVKSGSVLDYREVNNNLDWHQPVDMFKTIPRTKLTLTDQTGLIQKTNRGLHNPQNPYPTNIIGGNIELAKQAIRQTTKTFGKTALFVGEQAALHVFNPQGANIVNPFVITNAIPAGGLLGTAFDGRNTTQQQLAEPKGSTKVDRIASAAAGGVLGQEEGASFFRVTKIRSISDLVDYGTNALMGALGLKENLTDLVPLSPKSASLEKRLSQNDLSPENTNTFFGAQTGVRTSKDVYNKTYVRSKISGVLTSNLSKGFSPIQDEIVQDNLSTDSMLRDNLERAFESNAPVDKRDRSYTFQKGLDIDIDGEANASPVDSWKNVPPVSKNGMVFPFYFQSLNSFAGDHIEKYITFQATFNGLKENYTPSWDPKIYFGRSTAIYTYNSTARNVSFSFIVWAPNRIALGLVKQRVNWLARHCYPNYDRLGTTRIVKEAPIIKFTIGDLFRDTPAIITSLSYDWDIMGRWELTKGLIMPQAVKVDISVTILHDKFMQNAVRAGIGKDEMDIISSDFYEFIKPPRRGIGNSTDIANIVNGRLGDIYGALTENELSGSVDLGQQASSFVGNSQARF